MKDDSKELIEAQRLRVFIIDSLEVMDLSLDQQSDLYDVIKGDGGDFIPNDIELALIDIKIWIIDEKVDKLIALAKKLPKAKKDEAHYIFYINGEEVSRGDWMHATAHSGKHTLGHSSGTVPGENREIKYKGMTLEMFQKSAFRHTKLGEDVLEDVFGVKAVKPKNREFAPDDYVAEEEQHTNTKELGEPDEDDIDYDEFGDVIPKEPKDDKD